MEDGGQKLRVTAVHLNGRRAYDPVSKARLPAKRQAAGTSRPRRLSFLSEAHRHGPGIVRIAPPLAALHLVQSARHRPRMGLCRSA